MINAAIDPQNTTKKPITNVPRDNTVVAASPPAKQKASTAVDERFIENLSAERKQPLSTAAPHIFDIYTLPAGQSGDQDET